MEKELKTGGVVGLYRVEGKGLRCWLLVGNGCMDNGNYVHMYAHVYAHI